MMDEGVITSVAVLSQPGRTPTKNQKKHKTQKTGNPEARTKAHIDHSLTTTNLIQKKHTGNGRARRKRRN